MSTTGAAGGLRGTIGSARRSCMRRQSSGRVSRILEAMKNQLRTQGLRGAEAIYGFPGLALGLPEPLPLDEVLRVVRVGLVSRRDPKPSRIFQLRQRELGPRNRSASSRRLAPPRATLLGVAATCARRRLPVVVRGPCVETYRRGETRTSCSGTPPHKNAKLARELARELAVRTARTPGAAVRASGRRRRSWAPAAQPNVYVAIDRGAR